MIKNEKFAKSLQVAFKGIESASAKMPEARTILEAAADDLMVGAAKELIMGEMKITTEERGKRGNSNSKSLVH